MRKGLKIFLIVIVLVVLLWIIISFIPAPKSIKQNKWLEYRNSLNRPLISAHRGGSELNPENTEMAFDYIVNNDLADIIEIDVRVTKDNKLVIIHDDSINDTALDEDKEEVYVRDLTYEELLNYNFGYNFESREGLRPYKDITIEEANSLGLTIMLLEEFLEKYQDEEIKVLIEIKDNKELANYAADEIIKLLNGKYNSWKEESMIISFTDSVINYISKKYPEQYIGALGYKIIPEIVVQKLGLNALFKANYSSIQTKIRREIGPLTINLGTLKFIKKAHQRNQTVAYWTIDDVEDMRILIENGADIITTDCPDILKQELGI